MGDRRNVIVKHDQERAVALYTHWGGSELPRDLARGLSAGKGRWDDATYLTRILFCNMLTAPDSPDLHADVFSETGFGIEPLSAPDSNDYCEASPGYDLFVDVPARSVFVGEDVYTFDGFVSTFGGSE